MSSVRARIEDALGRVSPLPLALALLVPAGGLLFRHMVTLPKPRNTWPTAPGLRSVEPGLLKTRIDEVYPENALGPAQYMDTPFGKTKFALGGPEDGIKVVLIHGFSVPSIIFKEVYARLISAGFRVLSYDLFGRGYSDAPENLSLPIYTTQLALLFQHVSWPKARLVGLSMGGPIAADFANRFPQLVDGEIALLSAAGNLKEETMEIPRSLRFSFHPLISWFYSLRVMKNRLVVPAAPQSFEDGISKIFALQWKALPAYDRVLASTVRHGPPRGNGPAYAQLGLGPFRVLIMHGTEDEDIPYHPYLSPILMGYLPKAKLITLEGVGHDMTVTHPELVAEALIKFFRGE